MTGSLFRGHRRGNAKSPRRNFWPRQSSIVDADLDRRCNVSPLAVERRSPPLVRHGLNDGADIVEVDVSFPATDRIRSPGSNPRCRRGAYRAGPLRLRWRVGDREEVKKAAKIEDRQQEVRRRPRQDDEESLPDRPQMETRSRIPAEHGRGRQDCSRGPCRRQTAHIRRAGAMRPSTASLAGRSSRSTRGRIRSRRSRPGSGTCGRPDSGQARGRRRAARARRRTRSG